MPVMNGLKATRLIRSFEETGNWDAAEKAGILLEAPSDALSNGKSSTRSTKRIPIVAVSTIDSFITQFKF